MVGMELVKGVALCVLLHYYVFHRRTFCTQITCQKHVEAVSSSQLIQTIFQWNWAQRCDCLIETVRTQSQFLSEDRIRLTTYNLLKAAMWLKYLDYRNQPEAGWS